MYTQKIKKHIIAKINSGKGLKYIICMISYIFVMSWSCSQMYTRQKA